MISNDREKLVDDEAVDTEVTVSPSPGIANIFGFRITLQALNITLAIATVVSNVAQVVSLPLYAKAVDHSGSDAYNVLLFTAFWFPWVFFSIALIQKFTVERTMSLFPWHQRKFILIAGLMNAMNGLLVVYTADPARTPAYLQAILMTFTIPYTVLCRFLMLRKGKFLSGSM